MSLIPLLLLPACHLFASTPTVDCVLGEDCAKANPDTGDSGDTGEPPGPTSARGWILALDAGEKSAFRLYDPDASFVGEWKGFTGADQAAYDAETGRVLVIVPEGVYLLDADGGSTSLSGPVDVTINDLAWFNGMILATGISEEGFLTAVDSSSGGGEELKTGTAEFGAISVSGEASRVLYLDTQPTLYAVDGSFNVKEKAKDFDVDSSLADAVAIGDDGETYVCSSEGAIYSVTSLQGGDRKAMLVYDGSVDDVMACAWDKGDKTWLLGSPSVGIIRIDEAGRAEIVFSPPNGYTVRDISFY